MNIIQTVELGLFCHFRPLSYVAPTSICYQLIYTTHWQRCTYRVLLYRIWSNPTFQLSNVKFAQATSWFLETFDHHRQTVNQTTWTFWRKLFPLCMLDWTDIYFLYFLNKNGLTNQNFCSIKNVQWCTYNIFQNSSSLLIDSKKKEDNFNIYHVALNLAFQNAHIYIFILTELSLTKCWFFFNVKFSFIKSANHYLIFMEFGAYYTLKATIHHVKVPFE